MRLLGGVVLFACVGASAAGIAWAKSKGRAVPEAARQALWRRVCDMPDHVPCPVADTGMPTSAMPGSGPLPRGCIRRSTGEAVKPSPMDPDDLLWASESTNGLKAVIKEQGEAEPQDMPTQWLLTVAAGLPMERTAPGDEDRLIHLNPDLVSWFEANLLPPPGQALCGTTARSVYQQVFAAGVRPYAQAYAHLAANKKLKGVKRDELEQQRGERSGPLMDLCAKAGKNDDDWRPVRACEWWLRRAVSVSGAEPLGALLGRFLAAYDPAFFAPIAKHFPKK